MGTAHTWHLTTNTCTKHNTGMSILIYDRKVLKVL